MCTFIIAQHMRTLGLVFFASPAACVASSIGPLSAIVRTWKATGRKAAVRDALVAVLRANVRSMIAGMMDSERIQDCLECYDA